MKHLNGSNSLEPTLKEYLKEDLFRDPKYTLGSLPNLGLKDLLEKQQKQKKRNSESKRADNLDFKFKTSEEDLF